MGGCTLPAASSKPDPPFSPSIAQSFHLLSFPAGRVSLCVWTQHRFSCTTPLSPELLTPSQTVSVRKQLPSLPSPTHFSMSPGSLGHPQRVWARGLCGHWAAQSLLSPSPCPEHRPGAFHGAGDAQEHPNPITTVSFVPSTCLPSRNYPSPVSQAGREGWKCCGMCGVRIWCLTLVPAGDKGTVGVEKWGPGVTPWK